MIALPERLRQFRRPFYLLSAMAVAVINPSPDMISLLVIWLPLVVLFEVVCFLANRSA